MDNQARLRVYHAQCKNVRALQKARKQIVRSINQHLLTNKHESVEAQTKTLALIFCAWAEASFSKIIHTPHGFTLSEISQIKKSLQEKGIVKGWEKCINLAMSKNAAKKSNFTPNARKSLIDEVKNYIEEPSLIRNKIAHGQWVEPLNRANSDINADIRNDLQSLDVVKIEMWFDCQKILAEIIELLIESPNKAFMQSYWQLIGKINDTRTRRVNWTPESKTAKLRAIPPRRNRPT